MIRGYIFLLIAVMVASSCIAQRKKQKNYYEDLSSLRPEVEAIEKPEMVMDEHPIKPEKVPPLYAVDEPVNSALDSIRVLMRMQKFLDGYRLQLYSGQSRKEALEIQEKFSDMFPEMTSQIQYLQPKFRIIAGEYYTRMDAQPDLIKVKQIIPGTMLVPDKVQIH